MSKSHFDGFSLYPFSESGNRQKKKSLGKRSSYGETPAEANTSYKNILKGKIQISKAHENDFQPVDAMGFVGCFSGYTDKYADKPQVFF